MKFKRGRMSNFDNIFFPKNVKGQTTIFIIIAIILVASVGLFFIVSGGFGRDEVPSEIDPIYNTLTSCLEEDLYLGINILESKGGYIYLPEYESGSNYMPFSSQLQFLGSSIPYWYYVSGNNLDREQVPSKFEMESQLEDFIEVRARECFFDNYYSQGYEILMGSPKAKIDIKNKEVVLNLDMDLLVSFEEEDYNVNSHKIIINSNLGSLYDSATKVYEKEKKDLFLENYAVDTLRLYAPVDGIEMSCAPKVWNADDIFLELRQAIEANTLALKNGKEDDYFQIEIPGISTNHEVRFLNSLNWTSSFEVLPSEGSILISNPVGNQKGLGILGFCYIPYHFVYNINYPVLAQVISEDEIFQFPMAVIIQRNEPRQILGGNAVGMDEIELCKDKNVFINLRTYGGNSNLVESYISYECLETKCNIGLAEGGTLYEEFPQCVNGYVDVRAEGYAETRIEYSTVKEGSLSIYLDKLYNQNIQLVRDNKNYNGEAVIYFNSEDFSKTVSYPLQKEVELKEGNYEIQVYIYENSNLELGETTSEQCVKVPRSSIGGILGLTKEECFDVEVPAQIISNALTGGGQGNYTISESELKNSNTMNIYTDSLPSPDSLEQLQTNYVLFESKSLGVNFR